MSASIPRQGARRRPGGPTATTGTPGVSKTPGTKRKAAEKTSVTPEEKKKKSPVSLSSVTKAPATGVAKGKAPLPKPTVNWGQQKLVVRHADGRPLTKLEDEGFQRAFNRHCSTLLEKGAIRPMWTFGLSTRGQSSSGSRASETWS